VTNKSVIDIDIDDSKFKSFYKLYSEFMADIGKTTEQWEGLNSEIGKTSKLQTDVVGIPGKVTEEFKEAVKNVEKMNKSEEKGEKISKEKKQIRICIL